MTKMTLRQIRWVLIAVLIAVGIPWKTIVLQCQTGSAVCSQLASAEQRRSVVSIIRSDNSNLPHPRPPDSTLSYAQIEDMVRYAVTLSGGLKRVVPSDSAWIVIKPNIVRMFHPPAITDWRVVKALVKIAHQAAPKGKITIGEGPPTWMAPGHPEAEGIEVDLIDGFAEAGYRQLLKDPELSGIALDIVDLNFDEICEVSVPGGGNAREKYFLPKTILDCDVLISVPKMKMHRAAGITAGMKNMVGIAPGLRYGWPKMMGFPPGSGNPGLPHSWPVIDEMIVDLNLLAGVDFCVVDAILTQDQNEWHGPPLRLNLVLAGSDVVSVDAVCARIMGLNPDDIEHLTLTEILGLGIEDLDKIDVVGDSIPRVMHRFTRSDRWTARYGQGNRIWILRGPFRTKNLQREFIDVADPQAVPDENGWSGPLYFGHDKIDLAAYFGEPTDCVVYAYTDFVTPKTQPAELWVGSDEDMTVWINGKKVYSFRGRRRHRLPNERVPVTIPEGRNHLLVKIGQRSGEFSFSLNICEVEKETQFAGNRLFGLKFLLPRVGKPPHPLMVKAEDFEDYAFGEEVVIDKIAGIDPLSAGKTAPEKVILENVPRPKEGLEALSCLQAALICTGDTVSQDYLFGLSGMAFGFNYCQKHPWMGVWFVPEDLLPILCERLGYSYAYSYNEEARTAWTRLKGWISQGYPVIVWRWRYIELVAGYDDKTQTVYLKRGEKKPQDYYPWPCFSREWRRPPMFGQQMKTTAQFIVGDKIPGKDPKEGILASLVQTIRIAKTPFIPVAQDTFTTGFAAYELWLKELSHEVVYDKLSEDERRQIIDFDGYFLPRVAQNRKAAAVYLKEVSAMFDQPQRQLLLQAAERYQTVADRLEEIVKLLPQGDWRKAFIPEEERTKFAQRSEVAQLVREAYEQEREAVALLKEVVR